MQKVQNGEMTSHSRNPALVPRGHVMSFLRVKHDLTVYRKWYSYAF